MGKKRATLNDKTAKKEYALTQDEIIAGIESGTLQYSHYSIYGGPSLKLYAAKWKTWCMRNAAVTISNTR